MLANIFFGGPPPPAGDAHHALIAPPPPAVPVAAPPAPVVAIHGGLGRGRGRGRHAGGRHGGRARGFAQSQLTKERIRTAAMARSRVNAVNAVRGIVGTASSSEIVATFHGNVDTEAQTAKRTFRATLFGGESLTVPYNARNRTLAARARIVWSHVKQQALGIARYIAGASSKGDQPPQRYTQLINYPIAFDDASMWISRPDFKDAGAALADHPDEARRKKLKQKERHGRMAHSPVLNMVQPVVRLQDFGGDQRRHLSAANVVAPAQVLPAANWSTIYFHWKKWAIGGVHDKSLGVDPEGAILAAQKGTETWQNVCLIRDALYVNSNIVAAVERCARDRLGSLRLQEAIARDSVPTVFSANCAAHGAVLSCKPCLEYTPGLNTFCVRVGHLHQSSRFTRKWHIALKAEFDASFRYLKMHTPPDCYEQLQLENRGSLRLTRASRDLSIEQEEEICRYLNGRRDGYYLDHICLPGCLCGRSKPSAERKCFAALNVAVGAVCPLALEYRWKRQLEACAVILRSRLMNDFGLRTMRRCVDPKAVRAAEDEIAVAGPAADVTAPKQLIKAGLALQYYERDADGITLVKSMIMTTPLQSVLDSIFKAEKLTTELMDLLSLIGDAMPTQEEDMKLQVKLGEALESHLAIWSGGRGRRAIRDYVGMIESFDDSRWQQLVTALAKTGQERRPALFACSLNMICAVGIAYRRLVFAYEQPKFRLLASTSKRKAAAVAEADVADMNASRARCGQCIDKSFTGPWLDRLVSPSAGTRDRARFSLRVIAATTSPATIACEMLHLLGQETRKPRSRGPAVAAKELGIRTYVKAAGKKNRLISESTLRKHLHGARRERFGRILAAHAIMATRPTNTLRKARKVLATKRTSITSCSAWGEYQRAHWVPGVRPTSAAGRALRQQLYPRFVALPHAERVRLEGLASARTDQVKRFGTTLSESYTGINELGTAGARAAAQKRAWDHTVNNVKSDPGWTAAPALMGPWLGIREGLIDRGPLSQIDERINKTFRYSETAVVNPPGAHPPELVCSSQNGGVCVADDFFEQSKAVVHNVWIALKRNKLHKRLSLPLLARLGTDIDPPETAFFITDVFGKGELQIVTCAEPVGPFLFGLLKEERSYVSLTLHRLAQRMIRRAVSAGTPLADVKEMAFGVFKFEDAGSPDSGWRVRQTSEVFICAVSCVTLDAPPKKEKTVPLLPWGLGKSFTPAAKADDISDDDVDPDPDGDAQPSEESSIGDETDASEEVIPVDPGPVDPPGPPVPPVVWEPGSIRRAGLASFEVSKTSRSKCHFCGLAIPVGTVKIYFQTKPSTRLADLKPVHVSCGNLLPLATRSQDHITATHFAIEPGLPPRVQEELDNLVAALQPYRPGVASGSGG